MTIKKKKNLIILCSRNVPKNVEKTLFGFQKFLKMEWSPRVHCDFQIRIFIAVKLRMNFLVNAIIIQINTCILFNICYNIGYI